MDRIAGFDLSFAKDGEIESTAFALKKEFNNVGPIEPNAELVTCAMNAAVERASSDGTGGIIPAALVLWRERR